MFAIGRTFVCLATGKSPETFPTDLYGEPLWQDAAPQISEEVKDAIAQLLDEQPSCRITAPKLLQQLQEFESLSLADSPPWQRWMQKAKATGRSLSRSFTNGFKKTGQFAKWRSRILVATAVTSVAVAVPVWQRRTVAANIKKCAIAIQEDKLVAAQTFCERAIALSPRNGTARYTLGRVFEKNQDYERAESQYQRAIELGNVAAYSQLARLYILDREILHSDLFEFGCAISVSLLDRGLRAKPKDIERYRMLKNLGWALKCLDDLKTAEQYLQQAIAFGNEKDITGDRGAPHCLLAQVYESRTEALRARASWEKCLKFAHERHSIEVDIWRRDAREHLQNIEWEAERETAFS